MNSSEARQRLADGLKEIEKEAAAKVVQLKASIGDLDGDGDIDLIDVKIAIEKRIGGWSWRDSKVLAFGLGSGYVLAKIVAFVVSLAA